MYQTDPPRSPQEVLPTTNHRGHRGHREKISVIFVWEGSIFLVHLINYVRIRAAFISK
ncbi:hypothetical protein [Anabaena sp. AL93]|jgi:hypothetical protein|uniref:hypothetical protein n=1 Tax=Anabaena sp. AL93 TaxID=1678133 RepID=UPI000B3025A2|nr:hypothetical protein [Anabaena sp. AL93]MBO1070807.1 hypothetical protein [Dolichospermum sp. DEX189]